MTRELIASGLPNGQCHASTVAMTPAGPAVAFFAGTREGASDVGIRFSRRINSAWEPPREIARGELNGQQLPCWNPVLYQAPGGELVLFYKVGENCDRWWGMLTRSSDNGETWGSHERLPEGILGPVKNKPILHRGELICPSSTEHDGWRVHLETTPDLGATWRKTAPLNDGKAISAIQPSLLLHRDGSMQLLCRTRKGRLGECWSHDGGRHWSDITLTDLPNPNSGVDAVVLRDGRALLVYNPTSVPEGRWGGDRTPLCIAISHDGRNWRQALTLESEPGEYSYPAVVQDHSGTIHVSYTWRREAICYCALPADEVA